MVVEICQDNFFLHMLPSDDSIVPSNFTSAFYYAVILLSTIKNNSFDILVEIWQAIYLMYMLAKNVFLGFHESILCLV